MITDDSSGRNEHLHPAARVQERTPSSSSGGSSPSSYWTRFWWNCVYEIQIHNVFHSRHSKDSSDIVSATSSKSPSQLKAFPAEREWWTKFSDGMSGRILLKSNLPYQARRKLHKSKTCNAREYFLNCAKCVAGNFFLKILRFSSNLLF